MSNEVSNTRIYAFLSSFGEGGWVSAADQDGDNYIMRCEFYDFIKKEWNGEASEMTDDVISKFWNSIDTNKAAGKIKGTSLRNLNALDKNEMKNLEANLAVYIGFDEFCKNTIKDEKNTLATSGIISNTGILDNWESEIKNFVPEHTSENLQNTYSNHNIFITNLITLNCIFCVCGCLHVYKF